MVSKTDWARQLSHGSITAEDILVVMANMEFVTAAEIDRRDKDANLSTPWAMGFVDRDNELIEGLEEFEWDVGDGWEDEWDEGWGEGR